MFKKFWSFLAVALALSSCLNIVESSSIVGVSWIYQGTAQQNNSALTFNLYDTLSLMCKATVDARASSIVFAISKGTTPTGMSTSSGVFSLKNAGTLIYSDFGGLSAGYENFIIYSSPYNYAYNPSSAIYDFRYVHVGTLKTSDSATYTCSAGYIYASTASVTDGTIDAGKFMTSGGLTITVNTKSGQAHSVKAGVSRLVTYSAAIMSASKLLF